jgi:hypothetical protein
VIPSTVEAITTRTQKLRLTPTGALEKLVEAGKGAGVDRRGPEETGDDGVVAVALEEIGDRATRVPLDEVALGHHGRVAIGTPVDDV